MFDLSIATTMTNPEERNDPWKEALDCYNQLADELVVVGEDWPYEFKFDHIGKTFQKGFDKCSGDWVLRMDLDYFVHEKDISKIKKYLAKNNDSPAVAFRQYQFFTPDRYHVKTKLCIALNKKMFPNIKLNGGGDLCQPTINGKQILPVNVPTVPIPIWQYDSMFRTKEIIAEDRARFARAWNRQFNKWGDRGGSEPEIAYAAWIKIIEAKYKKHVLKTKIKHHPIYIQEKLMNLKVNQFGYDAFGLKASTRRSSKDHLKGYIERYS
jgi:hypothetical protein